VKRIETFPPSLSSLCLTKEEMDEKKREEGGNDQEKDNKSRIEERRKFCHQE